MDCLPYLEEMPLPDSLNQDGFNAQIEKLFESIFNKDKDKKVNVPPDGNTRQRTEADRQAQKRSEEIEKHNEKVKKKRERQKKRKDFWDKLRKKKN